MTGGASSQQRAAGLMRVARSILDDAGETVSAAHLQAALDALVGVKPVEPDEALLRQAAVAAEPSIVRAMGGALTVIATLMERRGDTTVEEISDVLGIYATITGETAGDEGLILAFWAATLRDAAQGERGRDKREKAS